MNVLLTLSFDTLVHITSYIRVLCDIVSFLSTCKLFRKIILDNTREIEEEQISLSYFLLFKRLILSNKQYIIIKEIRLTDRMLTHIIDRISVLSLRTNESVNDVMAIFENRKLPVPNKTFIVNDLHLTVDHQNIIIRDNHTILNENLFHLINMSKKLLLWILLRNKVNCIIWYPALNDRVISKSLCHPHYFLPNNWIIENDHLPTVKKIVVPYDAILNGYTNSRIIIENMTVYLLNIIITDDICRIWDLTLLKKCPFYVERLLGLLYLIIEINDLGRIFNDGGSIILYDLKENIERILSSPNIVPEINIISKESLIKNYRGDKLNIVLACID